MQVSAESKSTWRDFTPKPAPPRFPALGSGVCGDIRHSPDNAASTRIELVATHVNRGDDTEPPPRMLILISSTTGSSVPPPGSSAPSESETAPARPHTWLHGGIRKLRYTLMELFVMVVLESLVNPEI
jgi:hypothetical protein